MIPNSAPSDWAVEAPALAADAVHVWRFDLRAPCPALADHWGLLDTAERDRASRFYRAKDASDFARSHAMMRLVLGHYAGRPAAELAYEFGPRGKPVLAAPSAAISFNLSHSGGLAVLGVARRRRLGIDIERVRLATEVEAIAGRFFAGPERDAILCRQGAPRRREFVRYWCLKEAFIKAEGVGLSLPLTDFTILPAAAGDFRVTVADPAAVTGAWRMCLLPAPAGFEAALCTDGPCGLVVDSLTLGQDVAA